MKKIIFVFSCLAMATVVKSQTTWNQTLNTVAGNPYFGTINAKPINFFTNNTMWMTLSTTGKLSLNDLGGTGDRFLQVDATGQLKPWTGTVANANKVLMGDYSWKSFPFGGDATTVTLPTAGSKFGIGVSSPASALDVSGDVSASGTIKAPNGHLFTSTDGIYYDGTNNVFFMGKGTTLPGQPLVTACGLLPSAATWLHISQGGFACSQINPSIAPLVNANLRMYVSPSNGNSYIEVDGKDNTNATNNSLNLNYNCGRGTNINTGSSGGNVNICSGSTGNVGIGAFSSASSRLSISADQIGLNVTTIHSSDNKYNTQFNVNRDYAKAIAVINTANNPSGDENFTVFGDGRTRIGGQYVSSNESNYKLSVNGSIIAEEVVIMLRSSWPDYVFANEYKLMPLNKVEEYIRKNSHLPNVPSAKDIKEQGLAIADIISKQTEKIEELTLYLIEMKKEIEKLQKENEINKTKNIH